MLSVRKSLVTPLVDHLLSEHRLPLFLCVLHHLPNAYFQLLLSLSLPFDG